MRMNEFLIGAAVFVLLVAGGGMIRAVRGPTDIDRIMAVQLLGSGGIAVLVLLHGAGQAPGILDIALTFAILGALAALAYTRSAPGPDGPDRT